MTISTHSLLCIYVYLSTHTNTYTQESIYRYIYSYLQKLLDESWVCSHAYKLTCVHNYSIAVDYDDLFAFFCLFV